MANESDIPPNRCSNCDGEGRVRPDEGSYRKVQCRECDGQGVSAKQVADLIVAMIVELRQTRAEVADLASKVRGR
jgi:DnaJ-class molecular chaperone